MIANSEQFNQDLSEIERIAKVLHHPDAFGALRTSFSRDVWALSRRLMEEAKRLDDSEEVAVGSRLEEFVHRAGIE